MPYRPTHKTCCDCGVTKPVEEFWLKRSGGIETQSRCKPCDAEMRRIRIMGERPKARFQQRCSECGELGHNKRSHI